MKDIINCPHTTRNREHSAILIRVPVGEFRGAARYAVLMRSALAEIIAVSVGNTRTRAGHFRNDQLEASIALGNTDIEGVAAGILELPARGAGTPVVVASVNNGVADRLIQRLAPSLAERELELFRFGDDLDVPITMALTDTSTVGQDRLLNALGAYTRAKQACIIVDAGTAVTVDFVDGQGVFHGGAIAPGLNMMLKALHAHTAALPEVRYEPVAEGSPFGRETAEAMRLGVQAAVKGMVRALVERYSEFYGAFPQIVATGGDARALFESDDLVENIVPDLTLLGIQSACQIELAGAGEDQE
jgi:type III pantothenate kinase